MRRTSVKQFGTLLLALLQSLCEGVDNRSSVHLIFFSLTLQLSDLIQQPPASFGLSNTHGQIPAAV